ncbi:MAG: NADH-quinone oxidoreductase subunit J [Candidatus Eisenbacteria bacterium]
MMEALFIGMGAVALVSSLLVILHRNPVTSALFLVVAFCSLAGIYVLLHAEFVGMVQIIVYAGAIMVLFLFVIMYLNLKSDIETGIQIALRRGVGWLVGGVLAAEVFWLFAKSWGMGPVIAPLAGPPDSNTMAIGKLLYTRYLFPFEITSMILLAAMVGVIVVGKGRAAPTTVRETASIPREPLPAGGEPLQAARDLESREGR